MAFLAMKKFLGRAKGLKKKASELATLVDTDTCLIIQGPDGKIYTWPEDQNKVVAICNRYKRKTSEDSAGNHKTKKKRKLDSDHHPVQNKNKKENPRKRSEEIQDFQTTTSDQGLIYDSTFCSNDDIDEFLLLNVDMGSEKLEDQGKGELVAENLLLVPAPPCDPSLPLLVSESGEDGFCNFGGIVSSSGSDFVDEFLSLNDVAGSQLDYFKACGKGKSVDEDDQELLLLPGPSCDDPSSLLSSDYFEMLEDLPSLPSMQQWAYLPSVDSEFQDEGLFNFGDDFGQQDLGSIFIGGVEKTQTMQSVSQSNQLEEDGFFSN